MIMYRCIDAPEPKVNSQIHINEKDENPLPLHLLPHLD